MRNLTPLVIALLLLVAGCLPGHRPGNLAYDVIATPTMEPVIYLAKAAEPELVVEVDAEYVLPMGWGHVLRCAIEEITRGKLADHTIAVSIYIHTFENLPWPDGQTAWEELIGTHLPLRMGFVARSDISSGPPEGFRDSQGMFWELVFIQSRCN